MAYTPAEMDEAVEAWLESHRAYAKYVADTEALFTIFVSAWRGSSMLLSPMLQSPH